MQPVAAWRAAQPPAQPERGRPGALGGELHVVVDDHLPAPKGPDSRTFVVADFSLVHPERVSPDGEEKVICTRTLFSTGSVSTAFSPRTHGRAPLGT